MTSFIFLVFLQLDQRDLTKHDNYELYLDYTSIFFATKRLFYIDLYLEGNITVYSFLFIYYFNYNRLHVIYFTLYIIGRLF